MELNRYLRYKCFPYTFVSIDIDKMAIGGAFFGFVCVCEYAVAAIQFHIMITDCLAPHQETEENARPIRSKGFRFIFQVAN